MQAALLLLPAILQALPQITNGFAHLWAFVTETRITAQQNGAWTPDLEAKFLASLEARKKLAAYTPDAVATASAVAATAGPVAGSEAAKG